MLMFPYILNLLAAMLLGALIGAERQWRQRMAGLRTNALVATGARCFYSELHDDIARQPRANCSADCLRYRLSGGRASSCAKG
ncbi:magnesium transporter [Salmonella bongori]|nr:magnesium transporter [Salmonella bongori]